MGMSAYGESKYKLILDPDFFKDPECTSGKTALLSSKNLVKGIDPNIQDGSYMSKDEWGQNKKRL